MYAMHEQTSLDSMRTKQVRQIPIQLQPKHCIRIPCIRKWGAGFFCRIYVLWNIYIYMQMEDKKLRDPGIFKAKQIRCMWRSPFAPLLNFLNHEMVYKDSIRSGKWSQPPLEPNTRQNELCTTTAWLGMTSKKPDQPRVEPLDGHEVWR